LKAALIQVSDYRLLGASGYNTAVLFKKICKEINMKIISI
jgi:hypothetical protein